MTLRILVTDDDFDHAESLCVFLSLAGHEVNTTDTGVAAIDAVRIAKFDLLLLDVKLPGENGLAVARKIAKIDPRLEIQLMTALSPEETLFQEAQGSGFPLLAKPIDLDALMASIERLKVS